MISVKEAYNKVLHRLPDNIEIDLCREMENSYVFMIKYKDHAERAPGMIIYEVKKESGEVGHLKTFDPSWKNPYHIQEVLLKAPLVDISDLR